MKNNNIRICLTSSSGGHFEQLMMLKPLLEKYNGFIVTERVGYNIKVQDYPVYYVKSINRSDKFFIFKFIAIVIKSLYIYLKYRPNLIISTGALASVPLMLWGKLFRSRVVYIESFAKINSPNISGKIMYKFADQFYVQWETMKNFYPNAIFKGGIY